MLRIHSAKATGRISNDDENLLFVHLIRVFHCIMSLDLTQLSWPPCPITFHTVCLVYSGLSLLKRLFLTGAFCLLVSYQNDA